MNVYCRSQPYSNVVFLHVLSASLSNLLYKCKVPGACKKGCAWPCGGVDGAVAANAKSGRSVSGHNRWNAVVRKVAKAEGICNAGIWLSAKEVDQIIVT